MADQRCGCGEKKGQRKNEQTDAVDQKNPSPSQHSPGYPVLLGGSPHKLLDRSRLGPSADTSGHGGPHADAHSGADVASNVDTRALPHAYSHRHPYIHSRAICTPGARTAVV